MRGTNVVVVVGRLTRDVELKYTPSGTAVTQVSVAVDGAGDKDGDEYAAGFFDVEVWDKTAENLAQYKGKGDQICVTGRLKHHRWETQSGEKRSKVEIVATGIQFLGSKKDGEGGGRQYSDDDAPRGGSGTSTGGGDFVPAGIPDDDDIPF